MAATVEMVESSMDEHQKATEAFHILSNALFMEAMRDIENRIITTWKATKDIDARERLHVKQEVLHEILAEIGGNLERMARKEAREKVKDGLFTGMLKRLGIQP
jgi:hypothetical protein